MLAMVYLDFDRRKGRLSNALLFIFWFLLTISGIIILRTKILRAIGRERCVYVIYRTEFISEALNEISRSEIRTTYSVCSPTRFGSQLWLFSSSFRALLTTIPNGLKTGPRYN